MSGVVVVPQYLRVAMQTNKHLRNGNFYPAAENHRYLMDEANRIAAWRVKELASFSCPISAIPVISATARTRWRAYVHTSPFAKYIWARFVIAQSPQLDAAGGGIGHASADPFAQLLVEQTNGTDVGTAVRHYGAIFDDTVNDTPGGFDLSRRKLSATISGDTDYLLTVSDEQGARLVACSVYEVCKELDTTNGYLDSSMIVADGPILDNQLSSQLSILRNAWKRGASPLFNFASNTDATAPATSSTTNVNVIDAAGTVSAATPGWTLDLANRSTVRRSTVPCVFAVYAKSSTSNGTVTLRDSAGSTIASVSITSSVAAWYTATCNLPASAAKYDLHHKNGSGLGSNTTYAASLFQYET